MVVSPGCCNTILPTTSSSHFSPNPLCVVAMLCLNPQILDFMPAARGYILGLAFLAVAMYAMARVAHRGEFNPDDPQWRWGCGIASASMALAIAATYTNAVPVAALGLSFSAVALGGLRGLLNWSDRRTRAFGKYFLIPGLATGFCILWPYLIQTRRYHFYAGLPKAGEAIRDAFDASFLYKWTGDIYAVSLGALPAPAGSWQERVTYLGEFAFFPMLLCIVAAGVILAWHPETGSSRSTYCKIFGGGAIASVVTIVVLHLTLKFQYPGSRFSLYLVPLLTVGSLLAGLEIYFRYKLGLLKYVGVVIAAAVLSDYVLSLQVTSFRYNAYDVISRDLFQAVANDAHALHLTNARVGGTWWYEPEFNFYRRRFNATWLMEYDIKDRSYWWQTPNSLTPRDYNYLVFTPAGDPGLTGPHLRTIFRDGPRGITVVAIDK
jgi:hypothetical protein